MLTFYLCAVNFPSVCNNKKKMCLGTFGRKMVKGKGFLQLTFIRTITVHFFSTIFGEFFFAHLGNSTVSIVCPWTVERLN